MVFVEGVANEMQANTTFSCVAHKVLFPFLQTVCLVDFSGVVVKICAQSLSL